MKFILNRDKTLASLMGHTIAFKKGEPTHVPRECVQEALAIGAVPEEEIVEDKPAGGAPTNPDERKEAVFNAFEKIILGNSPNDFTAGNAPKASAVSRVVGWDINGNERDTLWAEFQRRDRE